MQVAVAEEKMAAAEGLKLSFGLRNSEGKYLTAETFGFRLNSTSSVMKKKQIFEFEAAEGPDGEVWGYFRTHLDHYLTTDRTGKFGGDASSKGVAELFKVRTFEDGRWALISKLGETKPGAQEYYAGGSGESLSCFVKVHPDPKVAVPADRLWTVQIAMHPQICIRSVNRKRYVHLNKEADTLTCDEMIPWGDDALITLVFFEADGKYALQASDGRFLAAAGGLKAEAGPDTKFILEIRGNCFAFQGPTGSYLSAGFDARGTVKVTKEKKPVSKDELFEFEDSHPQIKMTDWIGRKVSCAIGVEVCQQMKEHEAARDTEQFQMEAHPANPGLWAFRTCKDLFWTMADDGTIQCNYNKAAGPLRNTEYFTIDWLGNKIALKAANGKYVTSRGSGALIAAGVSNAQPSADGTKPGVISQYVFEIINRPQLVLRGEHGFVGLLPSGVLECNRSTPEVFNMHVTKGFCEISASNGKYFKVGATGITATGSSPEPYTIEFVSGSRVLIRFGDFLFEGSGNGALTATGRAVGKSTLWEY